MDAPLEGGLSLRLDVGLRNSQASEAAVVIEKNCRAAPRTGRVPGGKESSMKKLVAKKCAPRQGITPERNEEVLMRLLFVISKRINISNFG